MLHVKYSSPTFHFPSLLLMDISTALESDAPLLTLAQTRNSPQT